MPDPQHPVLHRRLRTFTSLIDLDRTLRQVEEEVIAQIRADLEAAREETIARLYRLTGSWDIARAQEILAELERHQAEFEVIWQDILQDALRDAIELGGEFAPTVARTYGIEITVRPFISRSFLDVSIATIPDLIKAVNRETINAVGRILRRSVLAQTTPLDVIRELGELSPFQSYDPKTNRYRKLTDRELRRAMDAKGPYNAQWRRMESIARTEIGRIAQTANYMTLRELHAADSRWQKEWDAVNDRRTRDDHAAVDGQRVPVDKPFRVGGEDLFFPHDPRASARQTINCRCALLPFHPAFEDPSQSVPETVQPRVPLEGVPAA